MSCELLTLQKLFVLNTTNCCKMCYKIQALNRNMLFSLYIYQNREGMSERIETEKRERKIDRTRENLFSLGCASYKG